VEIPKDINRLARTTMVMVCIALIVIGLYFGHQIIAPFVFSLLLSILLLPVNHFLHRRLHLPHVVSCILSVLVAIIFFGSIIYFISWQIGGFTSDWPQIEQNMDTYYSQFSDWAMEQFNFDTDDFIDGLKENSMNGDVAVGSTISSFSGFIIRLTLVPIYTFLILMYRARFVTFLMKVVNKMHHPVLLNILNQSRAMIYSYIVGLMMEVGIVALLTGGGYALIGIKYAALLGVITALLNLVPYIGIIIAAGLSMVSALLTSTNPMLAVYVVAVNIGAQFIDNNILIPYVVGSKVKINALSSILGVIIGGTLAGVGGMFLAMPVMAITKVVFDNIPRLAPYGYLIGDDVVSKEKKSVIRFKKKQRENIPPKNIPPESGPE